MPTTMVSITIEDSGIGMDQDFIDNHIFKPFAKANVHAVGPFEFYTGMKKQPANIGTFRSRQLEGCRTGRPAGFQDD
jgi:hypothetical protein